MLSVQKMIATRVHTRVLDGCVCLGLATGCICCCCVAHTLFADDDDDDDDDGRELCCVCDDDDCQENPTGSPKIAKKKHKSSCKLRNSGFSTRAVLVRESENE